MPEGSPLVTKYSKTPHIRTFSYRFSLTTRFLLAIHNLVKCCIWGGQVNYNKTPYIAKNLQLRSNNLTILRRTQSGWHSAMCWQRKRIIKENYERGKPSCPYSRLYTCFSSWAPCNNRRNTTIKTQWVPIVPIFILMCLSNAVLVTIRFL